MKSRIQKINQYLLQRYPTIWNTKLVWMLLLGAGIHLLFFLLGLSTFTNKKLLHNYGVQNIVFDNGVFFLSVIISLIILVLWLINLFKNNAFKNFYPTSRNQLFGSFLMYFIIFLLHCSYFLSYIQGNKAYIKSQYPDVAIQKQLANANLAGAFLSYKIDNYTLNNRKYPSPFDTLYCEGRPELVDHNQPYLQWFGRQYQFYTLTKKVEKANSTRAISTVNEYVFVEETDSLDTYYFKNKVVDVSAITDARPSYYNYSATPFSNYADYYAEAYAVEPAGGSSVDISERSKRVTINKKVVDLLNKKDPQSIKTVMKDFLATANHFKVDNNLTVDNWYKMVAASDSFLVQSFIQRDASRNDVYPVPYENEVTVTADTFVAGVDAAPPPKGTKTPEQIFYEQHLTDRYFNAMSMQNVFRNIYQIKQKHMFGDEFLITMWMAFVLAITLFIFRVAGLKSLLFSIVTGAGIAAVIGLVIASVLQYENEFIIMYFLLVIGTFILLAPFLFFKSFTKRLISIFMNLSKAGIVLYVFLIVMIISQHQKSAYNEKIKKLSYDVPPPVTLIESLGLSWNYIFLAVGLLFLYFYCGFIKKWKALPEN